VLLVGGSEAHALGVGTYEWVSQTGLVHLDNSVVVGCGLLTGGTRFDYNRAPGDEEIDIPDDCEDWRSRFAEKLNSFQPDIVIVMVGVWDTTEHRFDAGSEVTVPGEAQFNDKVRQEYAEAGRLLTSTGAELMWLDFAPCAWGQNQIGGAIVPACDRDRRDWMNALLGDVVAEVPGMHVLPYSAQLNTFPGGPLDPSVVDDDGIHLLPGAAVQVSSWLIPTSVNLWRNAHPDG
jgi:hypothetical protein